MCPKWRINKCDKFENYYEIGVRESDYEIKTLHSVQILSKRDNLANDIFSQIWKQGVINHAYVIASAICNIVIKIHYIIINKSKRKNKNS